MQQANLLSLLSPNNIVVFMLIMTRLTGMLLRAPFFSTIKGPVLTKVWFCAIVAFIIFPIVYAQKLYIVPHDVPQLIILVFFEFFIGYLIGFVASMILEGVRLSGNILSIQTGLSMSQALDPITGVEATELSRLYIFLVTLLFLGTGAHQMLFLTVFDSFHSIPIGGLAAIDSGMVSAMTHLFSAMFKIGFGVALPIFSVLLATDVLLGLTSKMMPQMNIYMVALPVKIYIGLFLILAFLSPTGVYLEGVIKEYMNYLGTLF